MDTNTLHFTEDNGLVVPIDVQALCVRNKDKSEFRETPYLFSNLKNDENNPTPDHPFLSEYFINSVKVTKRNNPGIYLHWALPDGLTRGVQNSDQIEFPQVPNRWLVTRVHHNAEDAQTKQWLIESDYISKKKDASFGSTAIPYKFSGTDFMRYQGRVIELGNTSNNALAVSGEYLDSLTAVGYGLPEFAASFNQCQSIFGLYDEMKGISKSDVSYTVVGYYGTNPQQLLASFIPQSSNGGINVAEKFGWATEQNDLEQANEMAINQAEFYFSGLVSGVKWDPNGEYKDRSNDDIIIGVGNTHEEALSALMANDDNQGKAKMLECLQNGSISALQAPKSNEEIESIDKELFKERFLGINAGVEYKISYKQKKEDTKGVVDIDDKKWKEISNLINQLNDTQYECYQLQEAIDSARLHIYLHWRCYIQKRKIDNHSAKFFNNIKEYLENRLEKIEYDENQLQLLKAALIATRASLDLALVEVKDLLEISENPTFYWQAKEPVVIFSGSQIKIPKRYGGDGDHTEDGTLTCRTIAQLCTKVTIQDKDFSLFNILQLSPKVANAGILNKLIIDLLLQDKKFITHYFQLKETSQWMYDGKSISPVGITEWQGNPWLPFQLSWMAKYSSSIKLNNDTTFDPDAFKDFVYNPETLEFQSDKTIKGKSCSYDNNTILNNKASKNLQKRVDELTLKNKRDNPLPDTLSQALVGLNDAFLQMKDELQFQIADFNDENYDLNKFTNETIRNAVGDAAKHSLKYNDQYNPVRTGQIELSELSIIDTFGQFIKINTGKIRVAHSLRPKSNENVINLPPRIVQPCRLKAQWLSAADETQVFNNLQVTNPVYAYLIPNYIDQALWFFTGNGVLMGAMTLSEDKGTTLWIAVPTVDTQHPSFAAFQASDDYKGLDNKLKKLLIFFNLASNLNDFLKNSKEAVMLSLAPSFKQFYSSVMLLGQPIAVADVTLEFNIKGLYAQNYSDATYPQAIEKGNDDDNSVFDEETSGFNLIKFPILIGNVEDTSDGLIACAEQGAIEKIKYQLKGDPNQIFLSLEDKKHKLTLFFDPRNKVHLRPSIIPGLELQLPPHIYAEILDKMQLSFQVAPVLSYEHPIAFPTPDAGNKTWQWQTVAGNAWSEPMDIKPIPTATEASFAELLEGWITIKNK